MIIYKVTNLINGKIYIGQTKHSLEYRKNQHFRETKSKKDDMYFHRALYKYGFDNFQWEIIENITSIEDLNNKEIFYINLYNSTNRTKGYNRKLGGEQGLCSEETKYLIGIASKRNWQNPEIANKMLLGLQKGTNTVKLKSLINKSKEIESTCKFCNSSFITIGKRKNFCSDTCYKNYMKLQTKGLDKANQINKTNYNLKQIQIIINCKNYLLSLTNINEYHYLTILNLLLQINKIKDKRTLLKFLNLKTIKEFKDYLLFY